MTIKTVMSVPRQGPLPHQGLAVAASGPTTNHNNNDTTPATRLPNETLGYIFLLCLDFTDRWGCPKDRKYLDSTDIRLFPWIFSYVCRRWRDACISYPKLWTFVALASQQFQRKGVDKLLDTQLKRSSQHALHVRINLENTWKGKDLKPPHPILPLLEQSGPRWAFLQIDALPSALSVLSKALTRGQRPEALQTLIVNTFDRIGVTDIRTELMIPEFSLGENAPLLRSVSLGRYMQSLLVPLPWAQLTEYVDRTAANTAAQQLQNLERMTSLERAMISVPNGHLPTPAHPVHLHNLKSLAIYGQSEILASLATPSLVHLQLDRTWNGDLLPEFFQRSQCSLEAIRFTFPPRFTDTDCMDLLSSMPDLTMWAVASFGGKSQLDIFSDRFFEKYLRGKLMPKLKRIRLEWCVNKTEKTWDEFQNRELREKAEKRFEEINNRLKQREGVLVEVFKGQGDMPPCIHPSWMRYRTR